MKEINITEDNFQSEVMNSDKPVLIDFWAGWCGPCRMLAPIIADIADEYDGKIKVCKVNVDEEPDLAGRFQVVSIPMAVFMKNGKVINTSVGYRPKEEILKLISDNKE